MPHAPSHLRDAFAEWVETGQEGEVSAEWFYDGQSRPIRWLFGQLWHCSDIMPWTLCGDLDMPAGGTYASAVQLLAAENRGK